MTEYEFLYEEAASDLYNTLDLFSDENFVVGIDIQFCTYIRIFLYGNINQKYAYKSIRFQYVYENQPERFKNDVDFLVDLLKDVTKKGISSH